MKYNIALLIVLFPLITCAQNTAGPDARVSGVFTDLKDSWTLGVDSNSTTVDIAVFNKYKGLFDINARVDDDLNFQLASGRETGTYKISAVARDFDIYAHDVALQVSKFRVDSVSQPIKVNSPDSIIYEITRVVYIEKPAKYVLQNMDALAANILDNHKGIRFEKKNSKAEALFKPEILNRLKVGMAKDPDSVYKFKSSATLRIKLAQTTDTGNPMKIVSIQNVRNIVTCLNDDDNDGILNAVDIAPTKYGDFTTSGAPDDDLDGISNTNDRCPRTYGTADNNGCPQSYFITNKELDGAIGLQFNSPKIGLPERNQLGYEYKGADATDVLQSRKGTLKNTMPVLGIYATGNFGYFFGKSAKHIGLSIGISYSRVVANYELADSIVYTYRSSDGYDDYRRQIKITSLTEKIAYNMINVPVQLCYRFKIGAIKNWTFLVKAGPSIMILTGVSDYKTRLDIGGIYQIDTLSKNAITYYDFFNDTSSFNVYLTASGINKQNTNPGAVSVFAQLAAAGKYDFVADTVYRDQKSISRITAAINLSLDGEYRKRESPIGLKIGLHLLYGPSTGSKEKYKPLDSKSDSYNSIFNSNGRSTYFAYGVNIGLSYNF